MGFQNGTYGFFREARVEVEEHVTVSAKEVDGEVTFGGGIHEDTVTRTDVTVGESGVEWEVEVPTTPVNTAEADIAVNLEWGRGLCARVVTQGRTFK